MCLTTAKYASFASHNTIQWQRTLGGRSETGAERIRLGRGSCHMLTRHYKNLAIRATPQRVAGPRPVRTTIIKLGKMMTSSSTFRYRHALYHSIDTWEQKARVRQGYYGTSKVSPTYPGHAQCLLRSVAPTGENVKRRTRRGLDTLVCGVRQTGARKLPHLNEPLQKILYNLAVWATALRGRSEACEPRRWGAEVRRCVERVRLGECMGGIVVRNVVVG